MSGGTLSVLGLPMPAAIREIHARTGVVPQSDNQDPDFTVVENLRMYARYFGLRPAEVAGRIDELLGFLELADRRDARMRELSGGMKRRLSIARALINDPEFIMLDEPTTGLDPQVRHLIWTRLRKLKASGKTLLLTTHYMDEAERLCDQLVVIDRGRIVTQGSPRGLIDEHVEPHVVEVQGEGRKRDTCTRQYSGFPSADGRRDALLLCARTQPGAGPARGCAAASLYAPDCESRRCLSQADWPRTAGITRHTRSK